MILLKIKQYIQTHQQVSESDLCNHFDLTPEALNGILTPLLLQGHVIELPANDGGCNNGACSSCDLQEKTLYQWVDKKLRPLSFSVEII